tara:strand:+ start:330 stop:545 length:216 start_codon:yes stop_codon:yes gene_type:complete
MSDESSIDNLTEQLLVACSNQKALQGIDESQIKELIKTLIIFQFSEDNRRSAQTNLDKIITKIIDELEEFQ